jgi:esterase/lipase superfamily enzyme
VEVLFATDRQRLGGGNWNEYFGTREGILRYGICKVSIPVLHKRGELERPRSLWILEFPEDPAKHVMLRDIVVQEQDAFFASLRDRLKKSSKNQALLFVHGFNNSFADAARRTAQLAHDLDFKGVPVFYSWPSFGSVDGYGADTETIKLATAKLGGLIDQILKDTQAAQLFLIAHSMGNEALTRAFIDVVAKRPDARRRIKELVLVAPDIDTRVFVRELAPRLTAAGAGVTLYAASDDVALRSAKSIRAGFSRAGDISDGVVIVDGVETIDATGNDTSFVGHAYFVVRDLYYLINDGSRAAQRKLTAVTHEQGRYWKLTSE